MRMGLMGWDPWDGMGVGWDPWVGMGSMEWNPWDGMGSMGWDPWGGIHGVRSMGWDHRVYWEPKTALEPIDWDGDLKTGLRP